MDNLNNLYIPIRERIFTLLKSRSIQQKDFAKTIGVSISTITDWKKGKSFSFMKKISPIAEALGTSEVWLLTGEGAVLDDNTIQKLKDIADSLDIHLFDLLGIGSKLDCYQISFDNIRRKDGNDLSPEDKRLLTEMMTMGPRSLYDALGPDDKREFWSLFQDYFRDRGINRSESEKKPTPVARDGQNSLAKQNVLDKIDDMSDSELLALSEMIETLKKLRQ